MSTSLISSLAALPQQQGGAGARAAQPAAAGGGAKNLIGSIFSVALKLAPSVMSAIPIVGSFAPLVSMAIPMIGSITGALSGARQAKQAPAAAQGGAMDAATAAALTQLASQMGTSQGGYTGPVGGGVTTHMPAAAAPTMTAASTTAAAPSMQLSGSDAQRAALRATLTAISQQAAGAELMRTLANTPLNVTVLDDAAYQAAMRDPMAGHHGILVRASDFANTGQLTTTLVNGLATAASHAGMGSDG